MNDWNKLTIVYNGLHISRDALLSMHMKIFQFMECLEKELKHVLGNAMLRRSAGRILLGVDVVVAKTDRLTCDVMLSLHQQVKDTTTSGELVKGVAFHLYHHDDLGDIVERAAFEAGELYAVLEEARTKVPIVKGLLGPPSEDSSEE